MGTKHEDKYTFLIISHSFLLRMRTFQTEVVEKSKYTFYVQLLFSENRAVYEIMRKNILQPDRPQMTIWRMRIACWLPETTNTHSECVIPIAFPLQQ